MSLILPGSLHANYGCCRLVLTLPSWHPRSQAGRYRLHTERRTMEVPSEFFAELWIIVAEQSVSGSAYYAERITEEPSPTSNKNAQTTVTLVYQTNVVDYYRNIKVLWCKNAMNHSLSIMEKRKGISSTRARSILSLGISGAKKGINPLRLKGAKWTFTGIFIPLNSPAAPNPSRIITSRLLPTRRWFCYWGITRKSIQENESGPALVEPLDFKKENVLAKKSFATRARFEDNSREHDIVVESSITGMKDPEMWISMDGVVLIHVKNLQWKFRGNQTVLVDNNRFKSCGDVHDWLFNSLGTGHGVFIFKPVTAEAESDKEGSGHGGGDSDTASKYYSTLGVDTASEFSLFLYAWKIE
ncbi:protein transport protein SFT2-like [Hibiscus syriacus]|uniref:Protein transport protein SFT2-like n=1 Tax=Hibiscus syriacus TaxID=106335 RepID=A0A6A3CD53_HIBSY|nr:protein transport protein SFT2-like [Hibiscus syriacus]